VFEEFVASSGLLSCDCWTVEMSAVTVASDRSNWRAELTPEARKIAKNFLFTKLSGSSFLGGGCEPLLSFDLVE